MPQIINWDQAFASGRDYKLISQQRVLELLRGARIEPKGSKALDLGCGSGDLTRMLNRLGAEVTGVDISAVALDLARSQADGRIMYIQTDLSDVTTLKAKLDRSYDSIWLKHVAAFIDDLDTLLMFIRDVLDPAGSLFVVTPIRQEGDSYNAKYRNVSVDQTLFESIALEHFTSVTIAGEEPIPHVDEGGRELTYVLSSPKGRP